MSKILKNTTGSNIEVKTLGVIVPASSQLDVEVTDFPLLASVDTVTELTPLINTGDIVVNDGSLDLSAAEGLRLISWPDRIYIKEDGVIAARAPENINFTLGLTATDAGSGEVNVSFDGLEAATEYYYAESEAVSSTTSTQFQQKLRLTTGSLSGGDYRINWSYAYSTTNNNRDMAVQIEIDDTTVIHDINPDGRSNNYAQSGGFKLVTITSGIHTIDLDFRRVGNTTARLRHARLDIWKVS